jgi:uronate dehydrogenase
MNKILLTGAAGIVGNALRPLLAKEYSSILLTDIVDIQELAGNETFVAGDITDFGFVKKITEGVSGIIHLAAMVGHYSFDEVLRPNFVGTYNIYESARLSSARPRVIFASSHHAVGFFKRGEAEINHLMAPRPDSFYGLSKAYGESLASLYADKFGVKSLSIRIGYVGENVPDERRLHTWISARDLTQLIKIGLQLPDLHHEIVYGVSRVPDPFFDNTNAFRLGYMPADHSANHLYSLDILKMQPEPDSYIGGSFAESNV